MRSGCDDDLPSTVSRTVYSPGIAHGEVRIGGVLYAMAAMG